MKTGTFAFTGTLAALAAAVAPMSPTILSLGAAALGLLQNDGPGDKGLIVVDFGRRKVGYSVSVSGSWAALMSAASGDINDPSQAGFVSTRRFVIEDASKTTGEWEILDDDSDDSVLTALDDPPTRTALEDELNGVFGYSRPSKSLQSVIDGIENSILALAARSTPVFTSGFFVYDQFTGNSALVNVDDTAVLTDFVAAMTEKGTQTVTASSGGGINNI